jgi:outer membrane protein TolC
LRIRASLQRVATTNVGIQLQADAAEAARKNLELVEDAYAKGVAASIDLLDAQNAALVARGAAANAEFDFFLALMESQRAVASFSFLETPEQRADFFQRLADFFEKYR